MQYLLRNALGFILAFELRVLYNQCYGHQPDSARFGHEPWPATQLGVLLLVPLALVLQTIINLTLSRLSWWSSPPKE